MPIILFLRLFYVSCATIVGWLVYVNLTQARVTGEEEASIEKMLQFDQSAGRPIGGFFLYF